MFDVTKMRHSGPTLDLEYHLCPWDRPILGLESASISSLTLRKDERGAQEFGIFRQWCAENKVKLVSCRMPHDDISGIGFLEGQGFRFIELNYHPRRNGLNDFRADRLVDFRKVSQEDEDGLVALARETFDFGRFHADPMIGARLGNMRYAAWMRNAFRAPHQSVLEFLFEGHRIGFAVVEAPSPTERFWSLIGLAASHRGRGLGRRIWNALLAYHCVEGVRSVSTSISSLNVPVLNLYAALGFRFPAPTVTLHWCPFGPLEVI